MVCVAPATNRPPEFTMTPLLAAIEPSTRKLPPFAVVAPVYVLVPASSIAPAPDLVRPNDPPTAPATLTAAAAPTFNTPVPPSVTAPRLSDCTPLVTFAP